MARFGVVLALVLLLVGCGPEQSGLTRDEYTGRANVICSTAIMRMNELIEQGFVDLYPGGPPADPTPRELQALYSGLLPAANEAGRVLGGMLDELRALPPPGELIGDVRELWNAFEARLQSSIERIENAAEDPDAAVELDIDDTFPFAPENQRAAQLGLTACMLS